MAGKKRPASKAAKLVRAERALRDREAIRVLREHFTGYGKADGYSLDTRAIEQMPAHRRRALRKKYTRVAQLLATPHVELKARTPAQAKTLRRETHQRFKGMKHFIVHVPDPQRSTAQITKAGRLSIRTKYPRRAEVEEQMFRFPRRARSPDEMVSMLRAMLRDMPDEGFYVMQTDTYGDTGDIADKGQLLNLLQTYLGAYDKEKYGTHRFMNRILGFRWSRSSLAGETVKSHRSEAREAQRARNRERREQLKREARRAAKKT